MYLKLYLIRKIKAIFLKLNLHVIFLPLNGILLNLAYLSQLSKWRKEIPKLPFDDFFNSKVIYENRFNLHNHIFESENLDNEINYIEFGVADGGSIKWWSQKNTNPNSNFVGFDTFTGPPEDFGVLKIKDFDKKGVVPQFEDQRVSFEIGLFQDTLPAFAENFDFSRKTILHMDADLYTSTLFVLTTLAFKLKKGDIIIFDEFGVPTHEFKAFKEFFSSYTFDYEVIGAINNYLQLGIKIK
ncbi:MAG TPA: TylF/MycF/NovP-related O-methyltransferase [Ignavibacteriaceae bacterium]|nr:TylF/MycF/NovP-related O-methyltransferase [Ignavibacteriaceae bacterium]